MKLIFSTLITFALIFNSEHSAINKSSEATEPATLAYTETLSNSAFEVGSPFYMDVDKDGSDDFLFHTISIHQDGRILTKYMVKGLGKNQVLIADGSAAIAEKGEVIDAEPAFGNLSWSDRHAEILESSLKGSHMTYNGTWSGDRPQYVGFKLVKNNVDYYGYAQVSIDPSAEKAQVNGYSVNRTPNNQISI